MTDYDSPWTAFLISIKWGIAREERTIDVPTSDS